MSANVTPWTPADIDAVRRHAPDSHIHDITELLGNYQKRGLDNPVAYAQKAAREGRLTRDLETIARTRKKTETARMVDELRTGAECEHGEPGGAELHPETGLPLCPLCRKQAGAAQAPRTETAADGIAVEPVSDSGQGDTAPTLIAWTAAELMRQDFPAPRWAVDGLVPEGVMFLAGAPKTGKSWLALAIAVAVASGRDVLGRLPTDQGSVLYLALEDTARRLQKRLGKILGSDAAPKKLTLATQCPPLAAGGLDLIRQWLIDHTDARLVIIDVFAKFRGPVSSSGSAYAADYTSVTAIKRLADEYSVAILLIHHMRKMADDDYLNELSGTLGLSGAADTVAGLKRERGDLDATLSITGRDVEENKYAMKFDAASCTWKIIGTADDYQLAETRRAILDYLKGNDGSTPKQIATGANLDHELVKKTVARMYADGQLHKDAKRGRYYIPAPVAVAVPPVPET